MHFFYKLVPPRPGFAQDMSAEEAAMMGQHAIYWKGRIEDGLKVFALGPVADPAGVFGMAVMEVESEAAAHALARNDPAIAQTRFGFRYEMHPMPRGVMHS
ncbi:MAG TPA: YciI family protein [Rhodanobacteraceae bacterium]|nr:YciI family protein [Rhodanobacteraceae bacterium]